MISANGFRIIDKENINQLYSMSLVVTKKIGKLIPRNYLLPCPSPHGFPKGEHATIRMKQTIKLRDYQQDAIDAVARSYENEFGGILKMSCGSGKTITALAIAAKIGRKTLIVVDKDHLADQWKSEIDKALDGCTVNIISRTKRVTADPIQICVSRSFLNSRFTWKDFVSFGLVILDEVHVYATNAYFRMFWKISRRYLLGLTATLQRKDGLEKVIEWHVGKVIFEYDNAYLGAKPIVVPVCYTCPQPEKYANLFVENDMIQVTKTYKQIMIDDPYRLALVLHLIDKAKIEMKKKKIIVICIFREQVKRVYDALRERGEKSVGMFLGAKSNSDKLMQEQAISSDIIVAVRNLGAQSLNIPDLDCMILASSYVPDEKESLNLKQLIGRLLRKKHEVSPVIFDVIDNFSFFLRQWYKRKEWYDMNNITIFHIETKKLLHTPNSLLIS